MGLGWEPRVAPRLGPTQEPVFLSEAAVGALQSSELQGSLSKGLNTHFPGELAARGPRRKASASASTACRPWNWKELCFFPRVLSGLRRGLGLNRSFHKNVQRLETPFLIQAGGPWRASARGSDLTGLRSCLLSCGHQAWGAGSRGVSVLVTRGVAIVMG